MHRTNTSSIDGHVRESDAIRTTVRGAAATVLLVSTDYPPLAGTNTRRLESFARFLPEHGWTPLVLTLATQDMALIESAWGGDGSVETFRVPSPGLQATVRRLRRKKPQGTKDDLEAGTAGRREKAASAPMWKRAGGLLWSAVVHAERACYVPDPRRLWAAAATRAAVRLARTRRIDAVVTSSPPFSAHFVGLALQRQFGIPWIADFRDLWVGRPFRNLPYRWQHFFDRRYEAAVVRKCDRLVLASPGWEPILAKRYGSSISEKVRVLTNGFDRSLLEESQRCQHPTPTMSGTLTILYTGAIHEGESPMPVARALVAVARKIGVERVRARIQVKLIGPGAEDWDHLRTLLTEEGLDGTVQFLGVMSHRECLKQQQEADVLMILSAPPHDETIRGKSFEYMATGKPILALLPDKSVQADILEPSGLATVVRHGDVEGCAQVLERFIVEGLPVLEPKWDYIMRFERRELTGTFAEILNECAGASRSNENRGTAMQGLDV